MKTLKITVAALALAGFATAAQAQDGNAYGALGVSTYEFDAYGVEGKLGYNFSDYFGVEGQGAIGIIDDETTVLGTQVDVGLDYQLAGFGVVRFPAGENFEIFARAGYHYSEAGIDTGTASTSIDDDGFAVGAGGQYFWDGVNGVRGEYTYYDSSDIGDIDVFSLSYVRKF